MESMILVYLLQTKIMELILKNDLHNFFTMVWSLSVIVLSNGSMMLVECGSKDWGCKVHWFLNGYPCLKTNKVCGYEMFSAKLMTLVTLDRGARFGRL
ncbi:hypothetical protein MtrunA17_Chr2g0286381 [Medicago truncatula]|uniref:Uncharacterized protein n=1 Tax=Medicago truncatula TaxID=3880 RepID=A0A396J386_MEDTR|nr:hypothetical protein MtrunA17_Chr2g0286381 [Medicago truncatula]